MVSNPGDIAKEFIQYFSNLFTSTLPTQNLDFSHEGTIINEFIHSIPSLDECLQIIKNMKLNASPGPDGLNVAFYRAAWSWIKEDVHKFVTDFYISGEFPDPINTTEIVLIPKCDISEF